MIAGENHSDQLGWFAVVRVKIDSLSDFPAGRNL
jgi:hypothetical protein